MNVRDEIPVLPIKYVEILPDHMLASVQKDSAWKNLALKAGYV